MSLHNARVGLLTIANGGTDSPALSASLSKGQLKVLFGSAADIEITAPAALTGNCTVQIVPTEGSTSWSTATVAGSTFVLPAGQTVSLPIAALADMRIHSDAAEGADRDFVVSAQLATM